MTPRMPDDSLWRRYLRFWGPRPERDVDDEIAFHVEARIDEYVAAGVSPRDARAMALDRLGDLSRYRDETLAIARQEERRRTMSDVLHTLLGDLRYGARQLRRNFPLTLAALVCFALGTGANTSIFSVVNAVLLRPLPFPDSDRLVIVSEGASKIGADFERIAAPDLLDFKETEGRTFESLALVQAFGATLATEGDAELVPAASMTPSAFRVLRVTPAFGRPFVEADAKTGAPPVVILSDALWRRRYRGDRSIVGKPITFASGRTAQVVGVMSASFAFPLPGLGMQIADIFFPFVFTPTIMSMRADSYDWLAFGRLRDGVSAARAEASLAEIARQMAQRYPESYGRMGQVGGDLLVHVKPMRTAAIGDARRPLLVLLGAVGFVLLIACTNVASLFVARAAARKREISIRRALGATRGRLAQQFLVEALILLGGGSALGVVAAHWATRALVALAPGDFYRSFNASIDGRVLAVTAGLTFLTALVFSILPGLRGVLPGSEEALREEGRSSTAARTKQRARRVLIVTEVAFALVLTVGAGLMIRSFARVRAVNPGFDAEQLLTFNVSLPAAGYVDAGRVKLAEVQLLQRLREIPGIQSVSGATHLPMQGSWQITFTPDGETLDKVPVATNSLVLSGFFETMRIPLRAGRTFTEQDAFDAPPAVIINETMARKYYGTTNAVGRLFKWGPRVSPLPWRRIVGVVADVKHRRLDETPMAGVYLPLLQQDTGQILGLYRSVAYVARTAVPSSSIAAAVRSAVRGFDPRLAVVGLRPMNAIVGGTIAGRRFNAMLLGLFAALALALAATGVYGVLQYSVLQRTREIGIRMAIGARASDMMRLIVGQALALALVGIALGLAGAFALTRVIRALLFDTNPLDVATFTGSAALLLLIAVVSSYLPARRALRVDPTIALRSD